MQQQEVRYGTMRSLCQQISRATVERAELDLRTTTWWNSESLFGVATDCCIATIVGSNRVIVCNTTVQKRLLSLRYHTTLCY